MSILFITQQKYDHINFMAIDTNFEHYAVSHDKNGSGGGSTVIRGNIKNTNIPSDLQVTSITAARGNINNLHGTSESFNDAEFVYLTTSEGKILKIRGDELDYTIGTIDELTSGKITTDSINTGDLYSTNGIIDILNSKNITTENLTVTGQAHFFELVIDKVKSVGGSLIITGANSIIAYVKAFNSNNVEVPMFDSNGDPREESTINSEVGNNGYFKVYWIGKDDATGRENEDEWYIGDQAYCQSFNVHEGTNFNASNKYYWRKVIAHESPVYMNLKTGEELTGTLQEQTDKATYNEVYINTPTLSYAVNGTTYNVNKGWNVAVQQMSEVTWTPDSSVVDGTTCGTMGTKGTTFGIQLTPNTSTGSIQDIVPETFSFTCDKSRLGVGFVYQDGSYEWFAAPEKGQTSYTFSLTTSTPIDTVIITNNDTVEWKLVRGIRLSNSIKKQNLTGVSSIPSIGDNIAQLGHRYDEEDSELGQDTAAARERASAIIIAAYKTPDQGYGTPGQPGYIRGLTPPSYAQYKLIKTFELSKYRHTFFDAIGSAFYGDFYAGSDNSGYNELEAGTPELFVAYAEDNGQGQADPNHWTKTPDINVTYDFMGYATATVPPGGTRADVEQKLQFSNYDWNMVPSATGIPGRNGEFTQFIYRNGATAESVAIPEVEQQQATIPTGWSTTATTPSNGEYTWCSNRVVSYSVSNVANYARWETPYRITGDNGQPGEDGDFTEFIYTRNNTGVAPSAPPHGTYARDWPNDGTTDHKTVNGVTWYDNPQGVTSSMMWEYVSSRQYNGSTQTWSDYSTPAVWGKWGEKGQDGDGYEYIFTNTWNTTLYPDAPPAPPHGTYADDWHGTDSNGTVWDDDPVGVSVDKKKEFVSMRKKSGNSGWSDYSTPTLWSQFVPRGVNGQNGQYTQFIYRNGATAESVAIPEAEQQQATIPTNWSASATTPATGEFTWCSNRVVTYDVNNNPSYGRWETPYRITGDRGEQGADGDLIEFIYTTNNTGVAPAAPTGTDYPRDWPNDGTTDHKTVNGVTWYDNPQGVSANNRFEYVSSREYDGVNETWSTYSTPALWSKYGENGRDGDGIEYIYVCVDDINTTPPRTIIKENQFSHPIVSDYKFEVLRFNSGGDIIAWKKYPKQANWYEPRANEYLFLTKCTYHEAGGNYKVAGYYPDTDWTDDPQELNATDKKVEYVAQRKYNGTTKTWSNFSTPEIWAMYGGTGPQGPQGNPGPQGANGTGYKLVNVGSKASYNVTLDSSNDTDIDFDTYFTYKIARIINGEVHYLTAQDRDNFTINGVTYLLYPYVKLKDTTVSTDPSYWEDKWYNLATVTQDPSHETCFYSFGSNGLTTAQKETFINNNQLFEIALIPIDRSEGGQSAPTILDPDGYATQINNALDRQEIKLTITSSAQLQIVQGDGTNAPSIKALVTGQDGLANNVSSLSLSIQGIQTRVDDLEDGFGGIQSQINQLPDEIEMSVYDTINQQTGIDITNGKISLNANNTEVNGGLLTVHTDSGIVWTDPNGAPKINIHAGDLVGNFSSATEAISYSSKGTENMINLSYDTSQRTGTITKEWVIQTNYNMLGKLPKGATISVSGITASCRIDVGRWEYISPTNYIQSKLELIYDSTVIATDTKNITSLSSQSGTVNHSTLSTTVGLEQTSGVWKIRATINLNNANIDIASIYGAWCYGQWSNGSYTVNFGTAQDYKVLEMANDGIDFYTSGSDHMKFQQDNFELTTGKSGIKIDNTNAVPLQKASNGVWVTNGNILRVKDLHNSTGDVLSNDYDLYLYTENSLGGGEHKFNLSTSNVPIGRTVYFKSTAQNINLINSTIVLKASTGTQSSCNIGTHFAMAVWTGSYWLLHY